VRHGAWKHHGQQGIKDDRAREIQTALIREHYLDGEATGDWDARTQAAMQKFQADNGWQTKVLPDSRALIKLGLGPDHSGLLNPETAAIPTSNVPRPATAIRQ
jgi:peptidoglycan hydrolase-like protein with peptidoglycan-binding domain